jgi:tight adherence protein B
MKIIIILCGGAAVFLLITALWGTFGDQMRERLARAQGVATEQLRAASIYSMTGARLVQLRILGAVLGALAGLLFTGHLIVALACAALGALLPKWWVERQQLQRLQRLEEVLPAALDQLTGSVRAGMSLPQALDEVSRTGPDPMNHEFGIISREIRMGARLSDSIVAAQHRIGGRFFPLFGTALRMNVERGGNLPEAMQRMSESFREIWRLEQKAITASAEARKAMRVIGAMPLVVGLIVFITQPDIIDTLTGSFPGWLVLAAVCIFYTIGIVWLKKLMSAEA